MNNNTVPTGFSSTTGYFKIQGTSSLIRQQKFTLANNQVACIGKNGTAISLPEASIGFMLNGRDFQIVLERGAGLVTGNFLETIIRNNLNTNSAILYDLLFRVPE